MRPARSAGPRAQESLRIPPDPRTPRPEPTFGRFAANGDGTTGTSGGLRRLRAVLRRPSETPPPLSAGSILIPGESRRPAEGRNPPPAGGRGRVVPPPPGYPWAGVESRGGPRGSGVSERDSPRGGRRPPRSRHTS